MSLYKQNLNRLFAKDMTRGEFLTHIGAAALAIIGVRGLMNHMLGTSGQINNNAHTYGTSKYGK